MATILEALQNAKFNLVDSNNGVSAMFGKEQLSNAVELLEKGYSIYDDVEEIIEEHGDIDSVPEKED